MCGGRATGAMANGRHKRLACAYSDGHSWLRHVRAVRPVRRKFWMKVFNDLKTRGTQDIQIAVFPSTTLQTCVVHLIRGSLDYASWKDRRVVARAQAGLHGCHG